MMQEKNKTSKLAHEFAHSLSQRRYRQAVKLKLCKKEYFGDIISSYFAGALNVIELIRETHHSEPFENIDELLGFIEIERMNTNNVFATKYCDRGTVKLLNIGEF